MALSAQQFATLVAAVNTEPAVAVFLASGDDAAIAAYYDGNSTTDAWSTSATGRDMDEAADYTSYDSIAAGKRDAWALFVQLAPRDMSKNKNRKVVTDIWGAATASSISENILKTCTRKATRAEALFGGNIASTGTVSAAKLKWEGYISSSDVAKALRG